MTDPALVSLTTGDLRALTDEALMHRVRALAAERRRIDAESASAAGELARRSDRALGYDGLAQRLGARTPEKLMSNLSGVSVPEARAMVTVGTMPQDAWLESVIDGVTTGDIGVGAAAAIKAGLGEPNDDIDAERLAEAARTLAGQAAGLPPEDAAKKARQLRDEIDAEGVAHRERALREKRYLRLHKRADGMTRIDGLLDPESAALVEDAFDRVTMPRRGGPRFVDNAAEQARTELAGRDDRSIEQVFADAFVQFVRTAARVDDGAVFGTKAPAVRVHVRAEDLVRGNGAAYAEGQTAPVAIGTVHRLMCEGGIVPILFDDSGQAINVGREIRPFTSRQRIAIAARDGGCMIPGCERPRSWTEAHHCEEWGKGGRTDIDNGISLCRHHHMWLHDTKRWITHDTGGFWLHAPGAEPERLPSKHPLRQRQHALTG
jgi:hypothetical protein